MPFVDYPPTAVKRVNKQITSATTTELVAAVSGKSIQVLALVVNLSTSIDATIIVQDDTGTPVQLYGGTGAAIQMSFTGAVGPPAIVLPWNPRGWFQTSAGQALDIVSTGTALDLAVLVVYAEIG